MMKSRAGKNDQNDKQSSSESGVWAAVCRAFACLFGYSSSQKPVLQVTASKPCPGAVANHNASYVVYRIGRYPLATTAKITGLISTLNALPKIAPTSFAQVYTTNTPSDKEQIVCFLRAASGRGAKPWGVNVPVLRRLVGHMNQLSLQRKTDEANELAAKTNRAIQKIAKGTA